MAYRKKRSTVSRRRRVAPAWYNRKYSVAEIAGKALTGVKYIKSMINAETHNKITVLGPQNVDYNGTLFHISEIDIGDTNSTRTGNSILLKNLLLTANISMDTVLANCTVRCIVFLDTMGYGTQPSVGDVLETVGSVHATLTPLDRNSAISGRFKILSDRRYLLSNNGRNAVFYKMFHKFNNTHIKYTGTVGTDEGRNQLYAIFISNVVTSNLPQITVDSRLAFYDN